MANPLRTDELSPRGLYTKTAVFLHWLMALMLISLFTVGLYMHDLPLSPWKLKIYSWHKWAGVTAFILIVMRTGWRMGHPPPPLLEITSSWEKCLSHFGHALLYLLMFAIPLSGWLMSSAKGFQTVYFGVLPIPDLLSKSKALGNFLTSVHELLNYTLMVVVIGHVGAVLKHQMFDKVNLIARMLPERFR